MTDLIFHSTAKESEMFVQNRRGKNKLKIEIKIKIALWRPLNHSFGTTLCRGKAGTEQSVIRAPHEIFCQLLQVSVALHTRFHCCNNEKPQPCRDNEISVQAAQSSPAGPCVLTHTPGSPFPPCCFLGTESSPVELILCCAQFCASEILCSQNCKHTPITPMSASRK